MASPQGPRSEDIVIRRSAAAYAVAVSSGPPQVRCPTFEEALDRAGRFAAARSVDVWWTSDGEEFVRLTNYGLMRRIWAEFMEMPGLGLTRRQAQRLWGMDERTCAELLDNLVTLEFLTCGSDGLYRRLTEGRDGSTLARMAKAEHKLVPDYVAPKRPRHRRPA